MDISKISIGINPPVDVNVLIENPKGGMPVKYELDKDSGTMFVDRFLHTSMTYPGNYGFIPHTLSEDGDPVDVLVLGHTQVMPGAVMAVRPVCVLMMEDDGGLDEKIVAVPQDRLYPYHADVKDLGDMRPILLDRIKHFFSHYKDLEKGKWAETRGWGDAQKAADIIQEGIDRAQGKI